jgi:anti-sigma factor RsiW
MNPRPTSEASPTDLELMLYADGELDKDRRAAVEAWLAGPGEPARGARAKLAAMGAVSSAVRARGRDVSAAADGIADAVMARIQPELPKPLPLPRALPPQTARPKRSSLPYAFAAVAAFAAAAAAMVLWRPASPVAGRARHTLAVTPETVKIPAQPPSPAHVPRGIEVSAVDFGAHAGTVYYVPSSTSAISTTAVLWLDDAADDAAEDGDE